MAPIQNKQQTIGGVQAIIAYTFHDGDILWEALHVPGAMLSATGNRNLSDGNKRLALLGDAIMKAALLVNSYTTTDTRAVGNNMLNSQAGNARIAVLACEHGIDAFIIAHPGQFGPLGNGPLADTLEAIIGAVWQDSQNLAAVTQVMETLGI